MVKLKYKFLISLIIICFSVLTVSASNINVMEEEGFFFQPEGKEYFVGKKKLDGQVLSEIAPSHQINTITHLFTTDQEALHDQVLYEYSDNRVYTYKSLYYPIALSGIHTITSLKDFLGNEMNYRVSYDGENTYIRIYYDSFMNTFQRNQFGSMVDDFVWKYGNEYIKTPEKIFIHLNDESVVHFDFKFYIPEFTVENTLFQNNYNGARYYIVSSDNIFSGDFSGEVQAESISWEGVPWDANVSEGKNEILFENIGFEPLYQIFFGEYDFISTEYKLKGTNLLCSDSERENIQIQFTDLSPEIYIYNGFNEFTIFDTQISKYDFSQKQYQILENINILFDENDISFSGELSDGLYNLKIENYSTLRQDICKQALNIDKKDYIFNEDNTITQNFSFIIKDQKLFSTIGLKNIFSGIDYGNFESINSEKLQFLDVFTYSVKTFSGEVISTRSKECIEDYECFQSERQKVISYFEEKGQFEPLLYDIQYQFFFNPELTNNIHSVSRNDIARVYSNDVSFTFMNKTYDWIEYQDDYSYTDFTIYNFGQYKNNKNISIKDKNQLNLPLEILPEGQDNLTGNYYYDFSCPEYTNLCYMTFIYKNELGENIQSFHIEYGSGKNLTEYFGDNTFSDIILDESLQDKKQKASQNNIFSTEHFFVKSFSGVLFARNIQTEYISNDDQSENVTFTFGATITGENVLVNYDKLFVCESSKRDTLEIVYGNDCYTVKELESRKILFEREVYLYGLDGLITGEGKNFETTIQIQSIPKYFPQGLE